MPYNNNRRIIKSIRTCANMPVGAASPKAPTVGSRLLSEWATEVAPTGFNTVSSLLLQIASFPASIDERKAGCANQVYKTGAAGCRYNRNRILSRYHLSSPVTD
ncbi:hypothetical protein V2P20_17760 [Methylobacter sp. Wu1]|uniref:hypothetical protein n=1 Tax=Methylobacter sp. Wu1 TaxID=3119359 RepID=UPI002F925C8A